MENLMDRPLEKYDYITPSLVAYLYNSRYSKRPSKNYLRDLADQGWNWYNYEDLMNWVRRYSGLKQ